MPATSSNLCSTVSRPVILLLDRWQLDIDQLRRLLALPDSFRSRFVNQIRAGNRHLPDEPAILRRAESLLRIEQALGTAFPFNGEYSAVWIRTPHRRFARQTPLELMLDQGEKGIVRVLCDVDCSISWDLSGSTG